MEKKINNCIFKLYDDCWIAYLHFNEMETSFEIYTQQLNEKLISQILNQLDRKLIHLLKESEKILTTLSVCFWGHSEITDFVFSGFTIGLNQENQFADFRMCFQNYGKNDFQDYANWMIDIKDFRITGCRREQL